MKIAFFELEDWQRKEAEEFLQGHELTFNENHLDESNVEGVKDADAVAVFIYSEASNEVLEKFDDLKLITTMSTGFDHIDLDYCKKNGITVCNVPTYGENTVAEHAFALILAISRKIYPSIKRIKDNHSFETGPELRGFDLKNKTIGIIGCGNIGKNTARMAAGIQMEVLGFDLNKDDKFAKETGMEYVGMDDLLARSDIISIHVPYNEHTHHLIDEEAVEKMKDGVVIVNTARGGIINTHALVQGLRSGKIAAAGLDVLEEESNIQEEAAVLKEEFHEEHDLHTMLEDHMLMKMDNVIITPHNAFNSKEALQRILSTTLQNIKSFAEGNPENTV